MKEFEKWFEETYPLPHTMERRPIGRDMKRACRAAYQEALKWVLKSQNLHLKTMLIQEIKKELEDEN